MLELLGNGILLDDNFEIKEYDTGDGIVLAFCCKDKIQSLIYKDKEKSNELAFYYFNFFDLPVRVNPQGDNYLVLGGGCMSYPRYYLSHYDNKKMDVVEINEKIIGYAEKYLMFDRNELDPSGERLNIIIDDALNYIGYCGKKYDYILVDLFDGNIPITSIYSEEGIANLKRLLNYNGMVVINYIISDVNKNKYDFLKVLRNNFSVCKIISNIEFFNVKRGTGNIIVLLSDGKINIPQNYDYINITNI